MESYAFRAPVSAIPFPANLQSRLSGNSNRMAKIIVLFDDEDGDCDKVWEPERKEFKFDAFRVNTKGFKFCREEANER
ncbi:MAG: hypothetical protein FWD06_07780 [Oscillospiraceae bacterium]|nr:hypothetical protein [Oscillospiraceae bacterium]